MRREIGRDSSAFAFPLRSKATHRQGPKHMASNQASKQEHGDGTGKDCPVPQPQETLIDTKQQPRLPNN